MGGDFIQLWSCEEFHEQRNLLEENVFWTCIWACKYVMTFIIKRERLSVSLAYPNTEKRVENKI